MYRLKVVVDHIKGSCSLPMHVGDYFEVQGGRIYIPQGKFMCLWALQSLMPLLPAKQRQTAEPGDWLPHARYVCCPDPNGMVVFRIDELPMDQAHGESESCPTLIVTPSVCSGCRSCELACSFFHNGVFDPLLARIRVDKNEPEGIDTPYVCRQCSDPRCVQACPFGALRQLPSGVVSVSNELCKSCRKCAEACPYGAVFFHPRTGKPLICDMCGGHPNCVSRCITGALRTGQPGERPRLAPVVGG
ncbi:MAG: TIGR04076 family protein [Bacillota bacterium]